MGERKRHRAEFFAEHKKCCFCGGTRDAVEIDHQPPKIFFFNKSSPQSLRYPSCEDCNRGSAAFDQLFAFWSRFDPTGSYYDEFESNKLLQAVKNNYPQFLPSITSNRDKRRWFRNTETARPAGVAIADIPMLTMPRGLITIIQYSVAKIAVANYYSHMKKPAPIGARVISLVDQNIILKKSSLMDLFAEDLKFFDLPKNANSRAQNQFVMKFDYNPNEKLFGNLMKFNNSIIAMVGIYSSSDVFDKDDFVISDKGFPWGTSSLELLGK